MARSEARLRVAIWKDQDYRALSFGAQWMYECLISQGDLSYAGVLALRESRWARYAAGMDSDLIRSFLEELADRRYVVLDDATEEVLVRSFMRHDEVWKQPNVLRAAQRAIGEIESSAVLSELVPEVERMAAMEGITERVGDILAEMLETLRERLKETPPPGAGNPSPNPSANPSPNPISQDLKTEGGGGSVTEVGTDSPLPLPPASRQPPPAGAGSAELSETQRSKRITDTYAAKEPMSKWPAVNEVVRKAIRSGKFTDDEIQAAVLRLADEGRSVTVDTLRYELTGFPAQQQRARNPPNQPSAQKSIPADQQCPKHRGYPGGTRDDGEPKCGQCRAQLHGTRPSS